LWERNSEEEPTILEECGTASLGDREEMLKAHG